MTRLASTVLALSVVLVGCLAAPAVAQDASPASPRPLGPPEATPLASPPAEPAGDGTGVRLVTELGDIVIGLFTESAPVASENFVNLTEAGFYDGTTFHRIVPDFVIQGGDPAGDGTGGPGYTIVDEPVVGRYGRGVVAMARTDAPNSQGSQFFIVLDDGAEETLDFYRTYVIFGRVVEGMDVVDEIAAMPNSGPDDGNRALDPVVITSATVEQVTLPPEPSSVPVVTGDPDLEALFPTEVGGMQVQVQSITGDELRAQSDQTNEETRSSYERLEGILATQGATLSDLSVGVGSFVEDTNAGISAYRVRGADAATFFDALVPVLMGSPLDLTQAPATIAGKDVVVLSQGPDAALEDQVYAYAHGEILWIASVPETMLTELFTALP